MVETKTRVKKSEYWTNGPVFNSKWMDNVAPWSAGCECQKNLLYSRHVKTFLYISMNLSDGEEKDLMFFCFFYASSRQPQEEHVEVREGETYSSEFNDTKMIGEEVNITYKVTAADRDHIRWCADIYVEHTDVWWSTCEGHFWPLSLCLSVSHLLRWWSQVIWWFRPLTSRWRIHVCLPGRTTYCTWRMSPPARGYTHTHTHTHTHTRTHTHTHTHTPVAV